MTYTFNPSGVCSKVINLEIEDDIITDIEFIGGCNGNLKGIAKLCIGKSPAEVIEKLKGLTCGMKPTSCPDQLTKALENALLGATV